MSEELKRARLERFKAEAKRPPPPLPSKRIPWAGGKIETSDKDAVLRKFLLRKLATGDALTAEQAQAVHALQSGGQNNKVDVSLGVNVTKRTPLVQTVAVNRQPVTKAQPHQVKLAPKADALSGEVRKLLKKLRDVEDLDQKRLAGEQLEANQLAKVQTKSSLKLRLVELQRS